MVLWQESFFGLHAEVNSVMICYLSGHVDKSGMKPTPIVILKINCCFSCPSSIHIIKHIEYKHIGTTPCSWLFYTLVSMYATLWHLIS